MSGLSALIPGSPEWRAKQARAEQRKANREEMAAARGIVAHVPPPVDPADRDEIPTKTREDVLIRDAWQCTQCPSRHGLDPHHRLMRSQGGPHDLANLITLCRGCHDDVHANPARSYTQGLLVNSNASPARISVVRRTSVGRGARFLQGLDGSLTAVA